ncbi:hypothetical protein C8F01DRAFT_100751 [Mycena amicta]|nr:hypothetical protein C8F01DRAFT_100751 [Mycena amicta]
MFLHWQNPHLLLTSLSLARRLMAVRSRAFNFECPLVDSNGLSLTEEHQDLVLGQLRCLYGLIITDHECNYSLSDGSPKGTEVQDCAVVANAAPLTTASAQITTVIQKVVTTAISVSTLVSTVPTSTFTTTSTLVYSVPTSTFTTVYTYVPDSNYIPRLSPALVGLSVIVALQSLAILGFTFVFCRRRQRRRAQNRVSEDSEGKFVVHRVTGDHDLAELADLAPPIPFTESAPGTGSSSPLLRPLPRLLLGLPGAEPFYGDPFETIPPEPDAESDPHFDERGGNHRPSDEASLDLAETTPGLALDVENALLRERIEMMEAEILEQRRVENHLPSDDASLAETTPRLALDVERENALLRERMEMMAAEIQEQRDFLAQMDVFPPQYRSRSVSSVSTSTD